jgi:hypothetical protein
MFLPLNGGMTKSVAQLAKGRRSANKGTYPPGVNTGSDLNGADSPGAGCEMKTIEPIPIKQKLPRTGEWVIAFTDSYRTVACYRTGVWWDLIRRTNIEGVIAWLSAQNS